MLHYDQNVTDSGTGTGAAGASAGGEPCTGRAIFMLALSLLDESKLLPTFGVLTSILLFTVVLETGAAIDINGAVLATVTVFPALVFDLLLDVKLPFVTGGLLSGDSR